MKSNIHNKYLNYFNYLIKKLDIQVLLDFTNEETKITFQCNLDPFLRGAYMDFPEYLTMDLNISYTVKQHHMVSF